MSIGGRREVERERERETSAGTSLLIPFGFLVGFSDPRTLPPTFFLKVQSIIL